MTRSQSSRLRSPCLFMALLLVLAGCSGSGGYSGTREPPSPPARPIAPPPPNMDVGEFVGRWGLAAYHKNADRARTEAAARSQCGKAYVIRPGPTGGVMMHLADISQPEELGLKMGADGRIYLGPQGPAPDRNDRELVSFDGRILVLRHVDPEVAIRYGTSVYVRCGSPATNRKIS